MKILLVPLFFLFTTAAISNGTKQNEIILTSSATSSEKWIPVWEDNFTEDTINDSYWTALNDGANYNDELQYYSKRNVTQTGDSLFLTAENEKHDKAHLYTSGKITTQNKVLFHYGKLEVRAKYPNEFGMFPAIWMLPAKKITPDGIAPLPEIDVFENVGNDPNTVYTVLHHINKNGKSEKSVGSHNITNSGDFHTYSIEWTHDSLKWYIDGDLVHYASEGVPTKPMYLNINLAVGGNWFPPPNDTTKFPAQFEIDYVRYYSNGGI